MAVAGTLRRLWATGASAPVAVLLLVAANLVPLIGVLAFDWDVFLVLILYWVENGIVGLFNIPKILLAAGPDKRPSAARALIPGRVLNVVMAAMFTVNYGFFWIIHGFFVMVLAGTGVSLGQEPLDALRATLDNAVVQAAVIGLVVSHGASFAFNFIGRREYLRVSSGAQMFEPYPRMVVLHVTIILGGFVILRLGQPVLLLVLMVVFKTVLDLGLHLWQHRRRQAGAPGADLTAQPEPTSLEA